MSVFSVCEFRSPRAWLLALALVASLAPTVSARTIARATIQDDSGRVVKKIRVSSDGVEVVRGDEDTTAIRISEIDGPEIHVDTRGAGVVRLFSDAHVEAGERVDGDVVAVFGSVRIEGEVTGNAVAVFGSVELGPRSAVSGDAVAVLGSLDDEDGSRVAGESVSIGLLPMTFGLPPLPFVLATIALGWMVSVFFGWMFALLFPERLARVAETASRRTALSFALGVLSGPIAVVATVLLLVTVVGVVLAVFMPFVFVVFVYAGQIAATYLLGCKLLRRAPGVGSAMAPIAAANTLVAMFFTIGAVLWTATGMVRSIALFFDLVGAMLLLGLTCIGTGAFLLSRFGSAPRARAGVAPAAGGPVAAQVPAS